MRTYKRKTEKGKTPPDIIQRAVRTVLNEDRYVVKAKSQNENSVEINLERVGYFNGQTVFSEEQKTVLADYLKRACDIYYGLTPKELRKFAYQYATANNLQVPGSWTKNKIAGADWYTAFIKRNNTLSLKTP
ncbi:hypothetical protein RN001_000191 [Aquatica leii]|uniref:Uncharacterized protein n=1 Tax=Aquatica leii TaxID=1421715 RepID=A0AAN7SSE4_9COLE|nr:hypothetical protein RN001_000191 [Aquatica leii]